MEIEQRAIIKFYAKLGTNAAETLKLMQQVYGAECLTEEVVFDWHKRFLDGREALEEDTEPATNFYRGRAKIALGDFKLSKTKPKSMKKKIVSKDEISKPDHISQIEMKPLKNLKKTAEEKYIERQKKELLK